MQLSDAEWKVMNAVWGAAPASARDVLEGLPDSSWAYTTVKTMLDRLVEKGALSGRLRANTTLYEPILTRQKARRSALQALAERAFGGTIGPLAAFLLEDEKLSRQDRDQLREILADELESEER